MGANRRRIAGHASVAVALVLLLASCGRVGDSFGDSLSGDGTVPETELEPGRADPRRESIFDLFTNEDDPNTTLAVNKYLWSATLDILNFLPIQSADPFSGVIVTGFGTPPGGGRAYRATVLIQDPALEARSLNVALATRSGPAPTETVRAVEDAILTRARQLRIRDLDL